MVIIDLWRFNSAKKKDLDSIYMKTRYALLPFSYEDKLAELRNWDLWGPLIFCLLMTLFIALGSSQTQIDDIFGVIYMVLFGGSIVVGVNCYLVGGDGSIFMMISILGYCLAPFVIAALLNWLLRRFIFFLGIALISAFCWFWAVKSASVFIAASCRKTRRWLALYPIMLYYMFFAVFIALNG